MTATQDPTALGTMQASALQEILRDVPMFARLSETERAGVAALFGIRAVPGGAVLCRQGTPGTELFIVITGRLRAIGRMEDGSTAVLGEIGRGELVGEMALMTEGARTADVIAIRDSTIAVLDKAAFDRLIQQMPHLVKQIARVMVARLSPTRQAGSPRAEAETLCLIPAGDERADLQDLSRRLAQALGGHGAVFTISAATLPPGYGLETAAAVQATAAWLNGVELRHRFMIYVGDAQDTPWTRLCLRQADRILFVANADDGATNGRLETLVADLPELRAVQELILVHRPETRVPRDTRAWLAARKRIGRHHHIRARNDADVGRVARILAGAPQGLVLGGGGARGFAHVGVYEALAENGFAVDHVGGTSIGAAFAALIAMGLSPGEIVEACRVFKEERVDLTLPFLALSGGFGLAAAARKLFQGVDIEDLWLPFYCVTTNLTLACAAVHRVGPLAKWVRASCSLPAALPPVFDGEEIHADGCLLQNVPVGVMRSDCKGPIVAVDVDQAANIRTDLPYNEGISGWQLLMRRINPFSQNPQIPHCGKLFHRAMTVSSANTSKAARAMADLYLTPPVDGCGVFDWKKGPRVRADAYAYAAPEVARWRSRV